jgi:hypothetical protein
VCGWQVPIPIAVPSKRRKRNVADVIVWAVFLVAVGLSSYFLVMRSRGASSMGKAIESPSPTPTPVAGQVIGARYSKIYLFPGCPGYARVSPRNRVTFQSEADALAAGFRKARNCP